jgi:hypothetical protein
MAESPDAAVFDHTLAQLGASGYARETLTLLAAAMCRAKDQVGEESYISPALFVHAVCQEAWVRWADSASVRMAAIGLWSTARIGRAAHLVSDAFGLAIGPETLSDYERLDTGSVTLPGRAPAQTAGPHSAAPSQHAWRPPRSSR